MKSDFAERLGAIPRVRKRWILATFDVAALAFSLWASFALRFGQWSPPNSLEQFLLILTAPLIAIPIFIRFGLYRAVIRYLPERALWSIVQATTLAALCWVLFVFLFQLTGYTTVPRTVPMLYWAMSIALIGGSRFVAKRILWSGGRSGLQSRPIAIYGAGESGVQLANALRRQGQERIVGFLDDSAALHGRDVAGIRVFPPGTISSLVAEYGVEEVILSIPTLTNVRKQEIIARISGQGVRIRTLPAISDLVSGKYLVSQIREIDIDDLLGRSSVPADPSLIRQMVEGRTIMVTGAGGSIGSELCRMIVKWSPQRLVLFEANEFALYNIERELTASMGPSIVPVLGSIVDASAVSRAMASTGVQVVFHAAAHKHVPLVEANALEGISNNVLGTKTVVDASYAAGVESFVLISSDKAVRPTNVMGATKRWAEFVVQQAALEAKRSASGQRFCAVRFGNVLGSNGSVVPLFKEQIAHGGPVTLTDASMTRYFMSIHEAAELIVQAGSLSTGGDVFLLDMGEPVLIKELAENMVRLAGFSVRQEGTLDGDIEIVVVGKRPGEKMYEELFYDEATAGPTSHPKIMRAAGDVEGKDVEAAIAQLTAALKDQNETEARRILFEFIE